MGWSRQCNKTKRHRTHVAEQSKLVPKGVVYPLPMVNEEKKGKRITMCLCFVYNPIVTHYDM